MKTVGQTQAGTYLVEVSRDEYQELLSRLNPRGRGKKYPPEPCPACGALVARSWTIRHMRSNCIAGIHGYPESPPA